METPGPAQPGLAPLKASHMGREEGVPSCRQASCPHRRHLSDPDPGDRQHTPGYGAGALRETAASLPISRGACIKPAPSFQ